MLQRLYSELPYLFAPDDGAGSGGGGGTVQTPNQPAPGGQTQTPGTNSGNDQPRTFTQDEVNAMLARDRRVTTDTAKQKMLADLGLEGSDEEVKAIIQRWKQTDDAAKSEADKQAEQLTAISSERDSWKEKALKAQAQLADQERRFAVVLSAKDANAPYAEDVYLWAKENLGDLFAAVLDEQGKVDADAVKKLIDETKAKRPIFFQEQQQQPQGQRRNVNAPGSPSNQTGNATPSSKNAEEARKAALRQGANSLRSG